VDEQPDSPDPDFHEYIKNPEHRRRAEREARRLASMPTEPPDDETVRALIEKFLKGSFDYEGKRLLAQVGARIIPFALAGLQDWRVRIMRYREGTHATLDAIPLQTLTDLLEPFGVKEAVPFIVPLVAHRDHAFRKQAALALGSIGDDSCVEPLTAALSDRDDYVRCYALMGVRRAVTENRATPAFKKAMYDCVAPLLSRKEVRPGRFQRWLSEWYSWVRERMHLPIDNVTDGNFNTAEEVPDCLLELDPGKAVLLLLDPRHFSDTNEYLYRIVDALNRKQVAVESSRIRALLERLRPKLDDYFVSRALGGLLLLLVRSRDLQAEAVLRDVLTWDNGTFQEEAGKALLLLDGVKDPIGFVMKRREKVGFKRLTKVQKVYYCIWLLDAEVRNGGFSQYFVNSSGNLAHFTRKALKALGATQTEAILALAMSSFGIQGPSTARDTRHEQLSRIYDAQKVNLSELDDAYYQDPDRLKIRLLDFTRRYKHHFRRRRAD